MDTDVKISELKEIVEVFCEERNWKECHNIKDLSIAIITEASELIELFRFKEQVECENMVLDPQNRLAICDEIADIFFLILRLGQKYKIDLSEELFRKLKLIELKYPK